MLREDVWIKQKAIWEGMIDPFVEDSVSQFNGKKVLSYGLSSYGYDLRLSSNDFRIYEQDEGIDPKLFNQNALKPQECLYEKGQHFFIMPPYSYGLGVALEHISLPRNVSALAIGKSTYARTGIVCNTTPLESGWKGYLTIELFNATPGERIIYAREGICQLLFYEGYSCERSYAEKGGIYDNQPPEVTLPN